MIIGSGNTFRITIFMSKEDAMFIVYYNTEHHTILKKTPFLLTTS